MKRVKLLYPKICEFENILSATKKAQKGKRFKNNVLEFNYNLEKNIHQIKEDLINKTYLPGTYKTFHILEPKKRMISAAPYRDRVVHHALCNIIESVFEPTFIYDSYANRKGKGTHRALNRFINYLRTKKYVLKCDIVKYFPNIDHEILKTLVRRKIKCRDTLWLIDMLIDNSNLQENCIQRFPGDNLFTPLERRKGLPIGNLTSQFFANIYLNPLDHYLKEDLRVKQYLRYVDDFALFSDDKEELQNYRSKIETKLESLRLKVHEVKTQITNTQYGVNFLGFRIFKDKIRIRNENLRRARKRLKKIQQQYFKGVITLDEVTQSIRSWIAHLEYGDTYRLRERIFSELIF